MRVVVAGGTGFLGRYITRALLDDGHVVTVLGRNPDRATTIPQLAGAGFARADVTEPASLTGVLDGSECVIAAVTFPNYPMELPRRGLTFDRFDRYGTENLLGEAKRAGAGHFVYVSGAGADPRSDRTGYRAKGRAEESVRASGMSWAIVRPSWAYGPEDRALNTFVSIARFSPVIPRLGLRHQRIQPVFVGDIAEAIARIFTRDGAWDRVYEIGGPDVMTMEQVIETMLEVTGKRRLIVPVPKGLAKVGTAPLVVLPKPPMTPGGVAFATQDAIVDNTEMKKVLDLHPIDLRTGLRRYLV